MASSSRDKVQLAKEYLEKLKNCLDALSLEQVAGVMGYLEEAYRERKQIFIIGNGGSGATASHMACDLSKTLLGRHLDQKTKRLRVVALTDCMPLLTAWANDLGYDHVFAEQLRGLAQPGDVLIVITGSGNSQNIVEAVGVAREMGLKTVGSLGFDGGRVCDLLEEFVLVASSDYGHIEDTHLILNHLITSYLKHRMSLSSGA